MQAEAQPAATPSNGAVPAAAPKKVKATTAATTKRATKRAMPRKPAAARVKADLKVKPMGVTKKPTSTKAASNKATKSKAKPSAFDIAPVRFGTTADDRAHRSGSLSHRCRRR